jgi:vesicle transport through interaction with t-SNAREs 1
MDSDVGTELFSSYENDFNLIIADISTKLQGLQEQDNAETKKSSLRSAERAVEEAEEIVPSTSPSLFSSLIFSRSVKWKWKS